MPKPDYRTITIAKDIYQKIQKRAEEEHRTVANQVEVFLIKGLEGKK